MITKFRVGFLYRYTGSPEELDIRSGFFADGQWHRCKEIGNFPCDAIFKETDRIHCFSSLLLYMDEKSSNPQLELDFSEEPVELPTEARVPNWADVRGSMSSTPYTFNPIFFDVG
jgi:hypothetical protein